MTRPDLHERFRAIVERAVAKADQVRAERCRPRPYDSVRALKTPRLPRGTPCVSGE